MCKFQVENNFEQSLGSKNSLYYQRFSTWIISGTTFNITHQCLGGPRYQQSKSRG